MRKGNLGLMATFMAMADAASQPIYQDGSGRGDNPITPADMDTRRYEAKKTNQRHWSVNTYHVWAATRKAAIKKAQKECPEVFDGRYP